MSSDNDQSTAWVKTERRKKKAMVKGTQMLREAIECARQGRKYKVPQGLKWDKPTTNSAWEQDPNSLTTQRGKRDALAARLRRKEEARLKAVSRDPCLCCGTRADLHGDTCLPVLSARA